MSSVRLPPVTLAGAFVENPQFRRERAKRLQRHHNNLKKMKPTIDATVPKCYVTFNKAKKKKRVQGSIPRARAVQIAHENEKLLERLIHIEKEPGPLNVQTTKREYMELHKGISFVGKKSSLHSIRRKKEYDRIVKENEEILQRLLDARERPQYYNASEWEHEREVHRHYMTFMTRFPDKNPPPDPRSHHKASTHAKSQKLLPLHARERPKQITYAGRPEGGATHTQSTSALPKRKQGKRKARVTKAGDGNGAHQSNAEGKQFDQETWTAYLQNLAKQIESDPQGPPPDRQPKSTSSSSEHDADNRPHTGNDSVSSVSSEAAEEQSPAEEPAAEHVRRYSLSRTSLNPRVSPGDSHVFVAAQQFSQVKQADEELLERQRRRSLRKAALPKRDSDLEREKQASHLQEMLQQQAEWRRQQQQQQRGDASQEVPSPDVTPAQEMNAEPAGEETHSEAGEQPASPEPTQPVAEPEPKPNKDAQSEVASEQDDVIVSEDGSTPGAEADAAEQAAPQREAEPEPEPEPEQLENHEAEEVKEEEKEEEADETNTADLDIDDDDFESDTFSNGNGIAEDNRPDRTASPGSGDNEEEDTETAAAFEVDSNHGYGDPIAAAADTDADASPRETSTEPEQTTSDADAKAGVDTTSLADPADPADEYEEDFE